MGEFASLEEDMLHVFEEVQRVKEKYGMPVVAQEETKEEFLLKKLEEYDFEEKRRRS